MRRRKWKNESETSNLGCVYFTRVCKMEINYSRLVAGRGGSGEQSEISIENRRVSGLFNDSDRVERRLMMSWASAFISRSYKKVTIGSYRREER